MSMDKLSVKNSYSRTHFGTGLSQKTWIQPFEWTHNVKNNQKNPVNGQTDKLERDVERDVFLKPPVEAKTKSIWRLKKCVYGLNEAARMWYLRVSNELILLGMQVKMNTVVIFRHIQVSTLFSRPELPHTQKYSCDRYPCIYLGQNDKHPE